MKDLHDAILQLDATVPARMSNESGDVHFGYSEGARDMRDAVASLALTYRPKSGRPWRATEEHIAASGEQADWEAWIEWMHARGMNRETGQYRIACAVADAMCPPPLPLANVLYDLIDDCFEKGRTPTPEEIEPFLRPRVKGLVWDDQGHAIARTPDGCLYHVDWFGPRHRWGFRCTFPSGGEARHYEQETKELAQAAAQSHWERRAMEFWREAFE